MSQMPDPSPMEAAADLYGASFYCRPTVPADQVSERLAPKISALGLEHNCRELVEQGYTVVEDVAPPDFIARLRERVLELGRPQDDDAIEYGAMLLLDKDPLIAEAALNAKLMAMAEFSVGAGFLLSILASSVRGKGAQTIPVHADQTWIPAPFPEHNLFLTCCWACDEFSRAGGATMVIPGSNLKRRHPTEEEVRALDGAIAVECPPGSAVLWDGRTWHGNWPRDIAGERVVLHVSYTRLLMRQMETYEPDVADDLIAQYGQDMAQLLGRRDFLGKPAGKSDLVGLWRAVVNGRT